MKKFRLIQLLTGLHCIHHYRYSLGIKVPFFEIAYFKAYGWKRIDKSMLKDKNGNLLKEYHNCTLTNVY